MDTFDRTNFIDDKFPERISFVRNDNALLKIVQLEMEIVQLRGKRNIIFAVLVP